MVAKLTENAVKLMCKRYLLKRDHYPTCALCGDRHENMDQFWERVSMGNAEYKSMLSNLEFLPNSPTLFNLGVSGATLSACFKFDVADQMLEDPSSIMMVALKAAGVLKYGGGVGYYLGDVRPEGSLVNSTHGKALGPLGCMRMYQTIAKEITQGGKRDAAQMAILPASHADIKKFIHCKDDDPNSLSTFNISVSITDDEMHEQIEIAKTQGKEHTLIWEIAESAWKTGDPGLYFYSRAERDNIVPWEGKLTGTNPCGEVPLFNNEPCNLGSINIKAHMTHQGGMWMLDQDKLKATARLATRYLDDVLDNNFFPDLLIEEAALNTRKLGLGVAGWSDSLALLRVHYDSSEALSLARNIMSIISRAADDTSVQLGKDKGIAPAIERAIRLKLYEGPQYRNVTRTCIAPTGTIAILMGISSGIEPHFSLVNTREMGDGTILQENAGEYGDFVPHVSHEIEPGWHIMHQAAFQEYTDLAVSKTVNLPEDSTVNDIYQTYMDMWMDGCKGGTIYRNNARTNQVLVTEPERNIVKGDERVHSVNADGRNFPVHHRHKLPTRRESFTRKIRVGESEGYVTTGFFDDGELGEIFIRMHKQGSENNALYDTVAILASIGLQYGVPFDVMVDKFAYTKAEPNGFTGDDDIPNATSVIDYIFRRTAMDIGTSIDTNVSVGESCPECGGQALHIEGCVQCGNQCGWSKC